MRLLLILGLCVGCSAKTIASDAGDVGAPESGSIDAPAGDRGRPLADAEIDGAAAADGRGGDAGGVPGDSYLPWAGGAGYYAQWSHGPPSSPSFFPISVWLQTPSNANRYKQVGINFFTGLYQGPTDAQLSTLASAGLPTICDQAGVWSAHLSDTTIRGWLQPDEPDNAQANGSGGYDPCIPPATIVAGYDSQRRNDSSRPVMLGLGRGVADTQWVGRGTCTGQTDMYRDYARGGDILAYDVYPVNEGLPLEIVAAGVDNLRLWSGYTKPVYQDIEASNFNNTARPTPANIKSEVWMALIHGADGIQYFCHRFQPTFSETDCLDNAPTAAAMTAINAQITTLAPVLNTPSVGNGVMVASSLPVDLMLKRAAGGVSYLFAAGMRAGSTTATFTLRGLAQATVEVLGESRTLQVAGGTLRDDFSGYAVHLYKITPTP